MHNLDLKTTLTNTGDETLKLLNDPRGALNKLSTDSFSVVNEATGASPSFLGFKVKYVPEVAAKNGQEDAFTILTPGASVEISHNRTSTWSHFCEHNSSQRMH